MSCTRVRLAAWGTKMSSSFGLEVALRDLAEKLRGEAVALEEAANVLEELRRSETHAEDIAAARARVAQWMGK